MSVQIEGHFMVQLIDIEVCNIVIQSFQDCFGVVDEPDMVYKRVCYYTRKGVLMRKQRPPDIHADEE